MKEITVEQAIECLNQLRVKNIGLNPYELFSYLNELKKAATDKIEFVNKQNYEKATECRAIERIILEKIGG